MARNAAKVPTPDYYSILQVDRRARPEVINASFKVLMAIFHPDRKGGNEEIAKRLTEAHSVLSDPQSREKYDESRNNLGGVTIGEYKVLEKIAEGGFGSTYRGEHLLLGQPVCIKHCLRISAIDEQILLNEARAMWDLRHFAVPAVRGVVKLPDGSYALVASYIPGPTLEKVIEKSGKLDPEHVCWIIERVLNALKYIHFHGVVHGDIKPQNIIVQPACHMAVLVDFGLSMIKPTSRSDSKGYTPYFAPPEQIDGRPLLPESDLYSMGVTMIYCLTGGNLDAVKRREVPNYVPGELRNFIRKLIVRDVNARSRWPERPIEKDLCDELLEIRTQVFGRSRSNFKPIPGFDAD